MDKLGVRREMLYGEISVLPRCDRKMYLDCGMDYPYEGADIETQRAKALEHIDRIVDWVGGVAWGSETFGALPSELDSLVASPDPWDVLNSVGFKAEKVHVDGSCAEKIGMENWHVELTGKGGTANVVLSRPMGAPIGKADTIAEIVFVHELLESNSDKTEISDQLLGANGVELTNDEIAKMKTDAGKNVEAVFGAIGKDEARAVEKLVDVQLYDRTYSSVLESEVLRSPALETALREFVEQRGGKLEELVDMSKKEPVHTRNQFSMHDERYGHSAEFVNEKNATDKGFNEPERAQTNCI